MDCITNPTDQSPCEHEIIKLHMEQMQHLKERMEKLLDADFSFEYPSAKDVRIGMDATLLCFTIFLIIITAFLGSGTFRQISIMKEITLSIYLMLTLMHEVFRLTNTISIKAYNKNNVAFEIFSYGFFHLHQSFSLILFHELYKSVCIMKIKQISMALIFKKGLVMILIVTIISIIGAGTNWAIRNYISARRDQDSWEESTVADMLEVSPIMPLLMLITTGTIFYFGFKIIRSLKKSHRFRQKLGQSRNVNIYIVMTKVVVLMFFQLFKVTKHIFDYIFKASPKLPESMTQM